MTVMAVNMKEPGKHEENQSSKNVQKICLLQKYKKMFHRVSCEVKIKIAGKL